MSGSGPRKRGEREGRRGPRTGAGRAGRARRAGVLGDTGQGTSWAGSELVSFRRTRRSVLPVGGCSPRLDAPSLRTGPCGVLRGPLWFSGTPPPVSTRLAAPAPTAACDGLPGRASRRVAAGLRLLGEIAYYLKKCKRPVSGLK